MRSSLRRSVLTLYCFGMKMIGISRLRIAIVLSTVIVPVLGWLFWVCVLPWFSNVTGDGSSTANAARSGSCSISGRIATSNGDGAVDATVCAVPNGGAMEVCVKSGIDGAYNTGGLEPGTYRVSASAGFSVGQTQEAVNLIDCDARSGIDVVLASNTVKLAGHVRDGYGLAVRNAEVRVAVEQDLGGFDVRVQSALDGAYEAFLPAGRIRLNASAPGYASVQLFSIAPNMHLDVVLLPGASLSGRVVDKSNRNSVPDVVVRAIPRGSISQESAVAVTSNAAGDFVLDGLLPGVYQLEAHGAKWRSSTERVIDLGLGDRVANLVVEVTNGVQLKARIDLGSNEAVCKNGHAVLLTYDPVEESKRERLMKAQRSGADLPEFTSPNPKSTESGSRVILTSMVDANKVVVFDGVPPGRYVVVAKCYGYLATEPPILEVADRDVADLVWSMKPAASVLVTVTNEGGQPIDDANIGLLNEQNLFFVAGPKGKGQYLVASVRPGQYRALSTSHATINPARVSSGADSYGSSRSQGIPFTVSDEPQVVQVALTLRGSSQVQVNVRAADGVGRGGLQVFAVPAGAKSPFEIVDATELGGGQYRIAPLVAGSFRVVVNDGKNSPLARDIDLSPGEIGQIDLTLTLTGRIDGRIVDSKGRPIPRAIVSAINGDAAALRRSRPLLSNDQATDDIVISDSQGSFALTGLDVGATYDVIARKSQGIAAQRSGVVVGEHLSMVIDSPVHLHGIVLDEKNQPVTKFNVQAFNTKLGIGSSATASDAAGHWRIEGIMPGNIVVTARDATGREGESEVLLEPGRDVGTIRLVLRPNQPENDQTRTPSRE